jgi:eukaryotic-like serine/threonine-protein kinase
MSSASNSDSEESSADESGGRSAAIPDVPAGSDGLVGRLIGSHYTVVSLLGTGPIGHTFRAKRSSDERLVALKILLPALRADTEFKRRYVRDVEAAQKLEHRHIARVFEVGQDAELGPFVCRELVEGEDLVTAVRHRALTPRRICELLIQALSAVSEAHRHGILHRDLKPQNVLVHDDENGRECIKLCDFANAINARPSAEYMAPEQGMGLPVDGQIDVYAVGVILYELLTGAVPFRGETAAETLAQHQSAPVIPPREKRPDRPLPRELEAVCVKALAKDPRDRHRSPREMSQALRAVVSLLGPRADEPLGSSAFAEGSGVLSPTASIERMTMPGEQLRSRTKFWLGAALVLGVCVAVFMNPVVQQAPNGATRDGPATVGERGRGGQELASGIVKLQAGDAAGAVVELNNARRALGDTPEVLRALGEALIIQGSHSEGTALLTRYLELEPEAPDREFVDALIRRSEQPK